MASRVAINHMDNLPVKNVKVAEGVLTRSDVVVRGAIEEDVNSYASPVVKGDIVKLVLTDTQKEFICVEGVGTGNENNLMVGVVVSDPRGDDQTTVSGQSPAVADQRMADVMFFGMAIVEVEVNGEAKPGDALGISEAAAGEFGVLASPAAANGGLVVLRYGIDNEVVPALVGFGGWLPAD